MSVEEYLRFAIALVFVLALIGTIAWVAKRLGLGGAGRIRSPKPQAGWKRRIGVVEASALDARRKLVLVRRDGVEHLVILGPNGETVVESGIRAARHDDADAPASGRTASGHSEPAPRNRSFLRLVKQSQAE